MVTTRKRAKSTETVQEMAARLGIVMPSADGLDASAAADPGPAVGGWAISLDPAVLETVRDEAGTYAPEMVVEVASADKVTLIQPGERVFLFVGGRPSKAHTPGLWAFGPAKDSGSPKAVAFTATWLDPPISRTELKVNPALAKAAAGGAAATDPRPLTPEEAMDLEAIVGDLYDLPA
jgi:hypothetical protein